MITTSTETSDTYIRSHERFEGKAPQPTAWLAPVRRLAIERFSALGFPTTREEAWKYTNIAPLARAPFRETSPEDAGREAALRDTDLDALLFGAWPQARLVFVNGHFAPGLSMLHEAGPGPRLGSLAADPGAREIAEPHLTRHVDHESRPFAALNTAFLGDGALVMIPEGLVTTKPIHLVFVSVGSGTMSHPRTLIVASRGSQATIVESYIDLGAGRRFTNAVTEIVVEEGAIVDHYKLQRESLEAFHVATMQTEIARSAAFSSNSVTLGGALTRNDVIARLVGEGADCTLNGLYALSGRQHLDNHIVMDHASPHGTSRQLYKGVLDGRSRGVFDGTVIVREKAQKTDSQQENRNLILSDGALVDTKPTLEIRADDVKCTHAATTGQIDETSMFYLATRAIDPDRARRIMVHAFISDIVRRIRIEPIRAGLDAILFDEPDGREGG